MCRQLSSKAKIGFDSITDMLRSLLLSPPSPVVEFTAFGILHSGEYSPSVSNADGPDTFAGDIGLTLYIRSNGLH